MYRLTHGNVVKYTPDPDKRDRLIADGYTWEQESPAPESAATAPETESAADSAESAESPSEKNDKPAKGKAAADGKSSGKA